MKLSEKILNEKGFTVIKPTVFNQAQGYDIAEVEAFLEDLAIAVESLEKSNERMAQEMKMLENRKEYVSEKEDESTTAQTQQEVAAQMAQPLVENEQIMALMNQYKEKVDSIDTHERAISRVLVAAEKEAKEIKKEAMEEANHRIAEARQKATEILTEVNIRVKEEENKINLYKNAEVELKERLLNVQQYIGNIVGEAKK